MPIVLSKCPVTPELHRQALLCQHAAYKMLAISFEFSYVTVTVPRSALGVKQDATAAAELWVPLCIHKVMGCTATWGRQVMPVVRAHCFPARSLSNGCHLCSLQITSKGVRARVAEAAAATGKHKHLCWKQPEQMRCEGSAVTRSCSCVTGGRSSGVNLSGPCTTPRLGTSSCISAQIVLVCGKPQQWLPNFW